MSVLQSRTPSPPPRNLQEIKRAVHTTIHIKKLIQTKQTP